MAGKRFKDLVFKGYEQEALRVLLDRPDDSFTVNEVAEETSASYNSVKSFLGRLQEYGILRFERKGSYRLVTYDPDNRYRDVLKDIFTVDDTARLQTAIEDAEELYRGNEDEIRSIVLFGSTARGTASKDSDIDVLILVTGNEEEIEKRARELTHGGKEFSDIVRSWSRPESSATTWYTASFEESVVRDAYLLKGEDLPDKEALLEEAREISE